MLKREFEKIAGYEVSNEDYTNIIEPMYMATDLIKDEFVKVIDKKRFALKTKRQMQNEMKKIAKHLFEICGRYEDIDAWNKLEKLGHEYAKRFYNYDWNNFNDYYYFLKGYEYEELQRGCRYPKEFVVGSGNTDYETIALIK